MDDGTDGRTDSDINNIQEISLDCIDIIVDNLLEETFSKCKNNNLTMCALRRGLALISNEFR